MVAELSVIIARLVVIVIAHRYTTYDTVTINPVTYISSTAFQTGSLYINKGVNNVPIIGLQVVMSSSGTLAAIDGIEMNLKGTNNTSTNISKAKLWYTGHSNIFAATTQCGTTYNNPTYNISFNSSFGVLPDTNYFWLTYDIPSSANTGDTVDAQAAIVIIDSVNITPTDTNPAGFSIIRNCKAAFSTSITGLQVDFTNYSVSPGSNPSYSWTFGDGGTSTQKSPKYSYALNGSYNACLVLNDILGCKDSICKQVVINPGVICNAKYSYIVSNDTVYFTGPKSNLGNAYKNYYWDFGDTTNSTQASPFHIYNSSALYNICLTVTDSNCSNKYCDTIRMTASSSCSAYYSYTKNLDSVYFVGSAANTHGNVTYLWDFGDNSGSTQQSVLHIYSNSGTYYVCLKITDSNCANTYCNNVSVNVSNNRYTLAGRAMTGNAYANPAMVWAVVYDSAAGTLTAVDSVPTDTNGYYTFNLNQGYYLIKVALDSTSSNYNNYLPTYYNNKLHWDTAYLINLDSNRYNINITMVAGNNPGGPGFIGGKTAQGANKTEAVGDPIVHVQIDLLDENRKAVAYTYSDANGNFHFANIAFGKYYLHPEVIGKKTQEYAITLSPSQPSVSNINVEVNRFYVSCNQNTIGIKNLSTETGIEIWPNPATDNLYIKSEKSISQIYITDITGKQIIYISKPENTIDVSSLDAGLYLIQIRTKEGLNIPYKFVKQ